MVRQLSNQESSAYSANEKSSSERCNYIREEQTDLLYPNTMGLMQSLRIMIRVVTFIFYFVSLFLFAICANLYPTYTVDIITHTRAQTVLFIMKP